MELLKKITDFCTLVLTLFLGFEAILKFVDGEIEDRIPSIIVFGFLIMLFICFYLARIWNPAKQSNKIKVPSFLPREEQHKYQLEVEKQKAQERQQEIRFHKIKKIARLGTVFIPLLLAADLTLWFLSEQSFLWRDLYITQINSRDVPELVEICSNSKYGIQIKYPKSWSCRTTENPFTQTVLLLTPQPKDLIDDEQVRLVVQVYTLPELRSLEQFTQEHINIQEQRLAGFHLIRRNETTFINQKGQRLEYEGENDNEINTYIEIFSLKDSNAYIITYLAEKSHFLRHKRAVEEIVKTLEILNQDNPL
jgi:hypothetical protein